MPILHSQFDSDLAKLDGTRIAIPPTTVLAQRGPVVQITIGVAQSIADELMKQGLVIPNPVSGLGLIDTGASMTCVDDEVARSMRLPAVDVVQMTSASHAAVPAKVYPIQVELIGQPILRAQIGRALGANLAPQGLLALIGRDFLKFGTLFYNGLAGQITLSF